MAQLGTDEHSVLEGSREHVKGRHIHSVVGDKLLIKYKFFFELKKPILAIWGKWYIPRAEGINFIIIGINSYLL